MWITWTQSQQLPFIRGVELHGDHVQGVPGGDADAPEQTQEGNHPRFTVSEHQEEAADAGYDTGSRWRGGGIMVNEQFLQMNYHHSLYFPTKHP